MRPNGSNEPEKSEQALGKNGEKTASACRGENRSLGEAQERFSTRSTHPDGQVRSETQVGRAILAGAAQWAHKAGSGVDAGSVALPRRAGAQSPGQGTPLTHSHTIPGELPITRSISANTAYPI